MRKRDILLITWAFPPLGGIGVQRALGLAKYLPQHGFRVHVLTAKNAAAVVHDPGLLNDLPEDVHIHRLMAPELPFHLRKMMKRMVCSNANVTPERSCTQPGVLKTAVKAILGRALCPDPQVLWVRRAIRYAGALIERCSIQTVLMTAPPFSIFRIGNALKKAYPHIQLISDYRDEWIEYYLGTLHFGASPYLKQQAAAIERETVAASDRVVAVTSTALDLIRARYPEQPTEKFRVIPNGYDPAAFEDFYGCKRDDDKIVLTFTGTLYAPSNPAAFLQAVQKLSAKVRDALSIKFVGRIENPEYLPLLQKVAGVCMLGVVTQKEAFGFIEESDYCLLLWNDRINIPGKLFEYLASGKPIFAIAHPDSEVARIIQRTRSGVCADISNPQLIADTLETVYRCRADREYSPDWNAIRRYERSNIASEYGDLVHSLNPARTFMETGVLEYV